MFKKAAIILCMGGIVLLPFLFQEKESAVDNGEDAIVVITPHTNSLRSEVAKGFEAWYKEKTGRCVFIDWRNPGGANEIVKYLDALYTNSFRMHWVNDLDKKWTSQVASTFKDPSLEAKDSSARAAFLDSNVSSEIDVWYGGGLLDFTRQAEVGFFIDAQILESHPEWFNPEIIPQEFAGSPLYDLQGRWFGTTFSTFGILYNEEILKNLGFDKTPTSWENLANPLFFGEVAISDPSMSGSFHKTLEGILQQQIQSSYNNLSKSNKYTSDQELKEIAIEQGWLSSLKIMQRMSANSHTFAKRSEKPILDIAAGNAAIGISIDYYAYTHVKNLEERNDHKRLGFILPPGEVIPTPDPVGILRGAPHKEVAKLFVEYLLSMEGQKLSAFNKDAPGGPTEYVLCRASIRKDFYKKTDKAHRFDADINPYEVADGLTYKAELTRRLFYPLKFIVKATFINPHEELKAAWNEIIKAEAEGRTMDARRAKECFDTFSQTDYKHAAGAIYETLKSKNALKEIALETELTLASKAKYKEVQMIAKGEYR